MTMQNMFSQFLNDPHMRHAVLVHFPVVFGLLGIVPLLALLMTKVKSRAMKGLCIAWFLMASGGAALAANSGEAAEDNLVVRSPGITVEEHEAIEAHEGLAKNGWIWPLIPAGLVLMTFVGAPKVRKPAFVLACIASLGVAGWVTLTAYRGGVLVYELGIGVHSRVVPEATPPVVVDDDVGDDASVGSDVDGEGAAEEPDEPASSESESDDEEAARG